VRYIFFLFLGLSCSITAQTTINFDDKADNKLYTRLYAHIDYNQKTDGEQRQAGNLDVHRLVTLFGYQFDRKTQFVSEVEFEHVKEVYVEQAFVKHKLTKQINLKAGLLLIPMGLVNEMHEPTFFYTVERPLLDKNIIPSTWSEIGVGISGLLMNYDLKYQLYLVNNAISYDGEAKLSAEKGLRGGRQKGAKSKVTTLPAISGQLEYFGLDGYKIGLSAYHGRTNTSLYDTFQNDNSEFANMTIDSSTVTTSMATIHTTLDRNRWTIRGQYTLAAFGETSTYNAFTGQNIPELMHGFYLLASYDFLKNQAQSLAPFVRFSHLNNHLKVSENVVQDKSLKQNIISLGINYKPNPGVVFKLDYQFYEKANGLSFQQFNTGIGVWF